ncbi:MAG: fibronectin type III domain-containing protein [candidate division KSB1 bacterium]|nr:fibronectin type III domain-containing protein [candidate division KSB1 bacterium]MDZ7272902.1 fibronectin type III domain-containing protein [candidate division KSB1 bacterium]MDZ7284076.1 fibronectin type III domain-containing protein [candidate division KSB1 bacterium]MDZ7297527.1 fibronectin type III domain-containing protein [candidate division KSB1 bacterium]MDZ7309226.1 fibronectin type III domain-containing protein [candidate division KSB1 bacterium]
MNLHGINGRRAALLALVISLNPSGAAPAPAQPAHPTVSQLLGTFEWRSDAAGGANRFDEAIISFTVRELSDGRLQVSARVDLGEGKAGDDYLVNPYLRLQHDKQYLLHGSVGGKRAEPTPARLAPFAAELVFDKPPGPIEGWHAGYESYVDGSHVRDSGKGGEESPALYDAIAPAISGLQLLHTSPTSIALRWETDEPAVTRVEYGATPAYDSSTTASTELATAHTVQLLNLLPNTLYHYRILASDAAGNTAASPDFTFTTPLNAPDTLTVHDDFERTDLGPNWTREPQYWTITNGELDHTPEAWKSWRYLTVYNALSNGAGREIIEVSYRWGKNVTALGVREGALALMVDEDSPHANGYWIWHRYGQVWLWTIKNGEYVGGLDLGRWYGLSDPGAGDVVTIKIRQESDGNHFDYYINGNYSATAHDPVRHFPKSEQWYVGFFLRGEEMNNEVDDFQITYVRRPGGAAAPALLAEGGATVPQQFSLSPNHPNPFRHDTRLWLHLPEAGHAQAVIYNLHGQEVLRLFDGQLNTGTHALHWNGTTTAGQASTGMYFLRILFEGENGRRELFTRRMILAR